jgi:hypothetical protein
MECDRIKELFPDQWAGTIDPGKKVRLNNHLDECSSCREEWESLSALWKDLAQLPCEEAGGRMHSRFYAMLEGYEQGLSQAKQEDSRHQVFWGAVTGWFAARPILQFGFAALLLLAAFLGGYFAKASRNGHEELAVLREEVHEMRQMVTISLLKQQSASERLKGVSWSSLVSRPDPEFLATLVHTLDYDPNVGVRLAAVDALSRFAGDLTVREGLIQSLKKQDSPMVQISLIDLLVQLHERQAAEALKQLMNDNNQNQIVRQRAQWGLQKLS